MAKLIASAGSMNQIASMIGDYFYSKEPFVLGPVDDRTYSVIYPTGSPRAGTVLENYRVVIKNARYRFELIREREGSRNEKI